MNAQAAMSHYSLSRAAARCWERAGHFDRAAERYARADAWADAGRCWAKAGRPVDAADAYARAGEPISEARQWLASQWPNRAQKPYRQALEMRLSTAAEVEALLGLGQIELASERAFSVASENGRSMEAMRSLARLAAARGRPDLAARAWEQVIAWSPAAAREVFEDWERAASWNRSLEWRRPPEEASGWPSRAFRDVRLELVWEEKLGTMMYGNRALAWSADGRRFAAARYGAGPILGDLSGQGVQCNSAVSEKMSSSSVAFIPESDAVLVGCWGGQVARVANAGTIEDIEALRLPEDVWGLAFAPRGDRLAASAGSKSGPVLRVWSWSEQGPQGILQENRTQEGTSNPSCAWSPDGRTLAWCPGPWSETTASNDLYLFTDVGPQCVSATHENGVNGVAFSPDGRYLITASLDRTLALRDAYTGETLTYWKCAQKPETVVFHPQAALLVAGGPEHINAHGYSRPSQLYLLRFSQDRPPQFEVIQKNATETAVCALAFSPNGEYLLLGTTFRLSLFRVHLT